MNSLLPLVKFSTQSKTNVDPTTIPGWEETPHTRMLHDSLLLTSLYEQTLPSSIKTRLTFNILTKDLFGPIDHIYSELDLEMPEEYKLHLRNLAEQQKGRRKGYLNNMFTINGYDKYNQFVETIEDEFDIDTI